MYGKYSEEDIENYIIDFEDNICVENKEIEKLISKSIKLTELRLKHRKLMRTLKKPNEIKGEKKTTDNIITEINGKNKTFYFKYRHYMYAAAVIIFVLILSPKVMKEAGIDKFKNTSEKAVVSASAEMQKFETSGLAKEDAIETTERKTFKATTEIKKRSVDKDEKTEKEIAVSMLSPIVAERAEETVNNETPAVADESIGIVQNKLLEPPKLKSQSEQLYTKEKAEKKLIGFVIRNKSDRTVGINYKIESGTEIYRITLETGEEYEIYSTESENNEMSADRYIKDLKIEEISYEKADKDIKSESKEKLRADNWILEKNQTGNGRYVLTIE